MGVLGKDLLDFHRPRTNTKVEFGASGYWVESHPTMQPYGAVLTEILNLDAAPFQELLDQYRKTVAEKDAEQDAEQAALAFQAVTNGFASLPLYRLYWNDVQLFASMDVGELFVGEAQKAFREYVMQDDTLPRFMQEQLDAIRLIQERYAWFLDGIFAGKPFEKKKGQRKTSLAQQIEKKGLEPFVSGVSLGADSKVDAPKVNAQFCIRGTGCEAEVVEKMYFGRLLDFVYVEFMKGLQKGFVPKRCANCGRWFLQTPGATYAYCTGAAPGQDGKTCREIGASSSFRSKVENNDVWKVHQRAYKKYFARIRSGLMTKGEFEAWTRDAEQKRDAALEPYARAESEEERQRIAQEVAEALNEA